MSLGFADLPGAPADQHLDDLTRSSTDFNANLADSQRLTPWRCRVASFHPHSKFVQDESRKAPKQRSWFLILTDLQRFKRRLCWWNWQSWHLCPRPLAPIFNDQPSLAALGPWAIAEDLDLPYLALPCCLGFRATSLAPLMAASCSAVLPRRFCLPVVRSTRSARRTPWRGPALISLGSTPKQH